jgi:hypothetical protein
MGSVALKSNKPPSFATASAAKKIVWNIIGIVLGSKSREKPDWVIAPKPTSHVNVATELGEGVGE